MKVLVVIDVEKKCHVFDAESADIKRQLMNALREFCDENSKADKALAKLASEEFMTLEDMIKKLIQYPDLPIFGNNGVYLNDVETTGLKSHIFS